MPNKIIKIHAMLVLPMKGKTRTASLVADKVPLNGKLFELLEKIFINSDDECNIPISFDAPQQNQKNEMRDLLVDYLGNAKKKSAVKIGEKLESVTTKRSGYGLLFIISGTKGSKNKVVISRFPADEAIVAEQKNSKLTVGFLEQVFLKNAQHYKSVLYIDLTKTSQTWSGRAIDKQIDKGGIYMSDYWTFDFLQSSLMTTSASGTRRFAKAFKDASASSQQLTVQKELTAAAILLPQLGGQTLSAKDLASKLNLSANATNAIKKAMKHPALFTEKFQVDVAMFESLVKFRAVQLDNGGLLVAPAHKFNDVFVENTHIGAQGEVEFTTKGRVVKEKLRNSA